MAERKLLAMDLGTATGYALRICGKVSISTESFALRKSDSPGMRYLRFVKFLKLLHDATGFTLVVYEKVNRHMGTEAAHVYGAFEGHLHAFCAEHGIDHSGVGVTEIKKFATGKGNANKDAMLAWAKARPEAVDNLPIDDNGADALAVLLYAELHL